jgi:hypothetical protein
MQRTASKPATDARGVCHPRCASVAGCSGLAVADLVLVRCYDDARDPWHSEV